MGLFCENDIDTKPSHANLNVFFELYVVTCMQVIKLYNTRPNISLSFFPSFSFFVLGSVDVDAGEDILDNLKRYVYMYI